MAAAHVLPTLVVGLNLGDGKEEEGEPTTSTLRRARRHTGPSTARSVSICHFSKQAERHLLVRSPVVFASRWTLSSLPTQWGKRGCSTGLKRPERSRDDFT